jgi:hypothetical protein
VLDFKSAVSGNMLDLALGFSHPVKVEIPAGITATAEKNVITISGIDKETVGQFSAYVRSLKKPEPYKGKGFRYDDEVIRRNKVKNLHNNLELTFKIISHPAERKRPHAKYHLKFVLCIVIPDSIRYPVFAFHQYLSAGSVLECSQFNFLNVHLNFIIMKTLKITTLQSESVYIKKFVHVFLELNHDLDCQCSDQTNSSMHKSLMIQQEKLL